MSIPLQFFIYLLLVLDRIWQSIPSDTYIVDKATAANAINVLNVASIENGFGKTTKDVKVVFMSGPKNALGASDCNGTIFLNTTWLDENYSLYGTPMWIATISHELGHIYQGYNCNNSNEWGENVAMIMEWENMAKIATRDHKYYAALIYDLRDTVRFVVMIRLIENGDDPNRLFVWMKTSDKEKNAYLESIKYCQSNLGRCQKYNREYAEVPLTKILLSGYGKISDKRMSVTADDTLHFIMLILPVEWYDYYLYPY